MVDKYKSFTSRADNIKEVVSAEHINDLQDVAMVLQRSFFALRGQTFLQRALFVLEQHPEFDAMWCDTLDDNTRIDGLRSSGIAYITDERAVSFSPFNSTLQGMYFTATHPTIHHGPGKIVGLMVDDYIPEGTHIEYAVSNDAYDFYPVTPNDGTSTFVIPTDGSELKVRLTLYRNPDTEDWPRVYAIALLYVTGGALNA